MRINRRNHQVRRLGNLLWLGVTALLAVMPLRAATSDLWGNHGELWKPTSRLPDFSFAGYHFGSDPLPDGPVVVKVTDFGAVGDGKTDCTDAFRKAIEKTERGVILIPEGRYVIRDILWINKPDLVLRGEGAGRTVILPVTELEEVRPNMGSTTSGKPTSGYSWSGGFIWVKGKVDRASLTSVTADASRGARRLEVKDASKLKRGQRVALKMKDAEDRSLLSHLYSDDSGDTKKIKGSVTTEFVSRVERVEGNVVTLERPLRLDVRGKWSPKLTSFDPAVSEVGIERLAIEFPVKPYGGHFSERGMNGIAMNGVADCWVRDVMISHADSGLFMAGQNCTVDGLILDSKRKMNRGATGHHGITGGHDCLVQRFDIRTHFIHDLTITNRQSGNVFKQGRAINLSIDHHKRAPFENLICNVDAGKGSELWRCGGGASLGKHCGARGTFWSIRTDHAVSLPPSKFGPASMNFIGLNTRQASVKEKNGRWLEAVPPKQLEPADLHAAQVKRRLAARRR